MVASRSDETTKTSPLDTMAGLTVRRLALSQDVAAAKYASRQSIDDPIRERQVVEAAGCALNGTGKRRYVGLQFARDQIEASRVVQRELHQRWYAHPEEVPAVRRDLVSEVWPDLDWVTLRLMRQFRDLIDLPRLPADAVEDLIDRQLAMTLPAPPLPGPYRHAALFAFRTFCQQW
jgi:chorismate mutase